MYILDMCMYIYIHTQMHTHACTYTHMQTQVFLFQTLKASGKLRLIKFKLQVSSVMGPL